MCGQQRTQFHRITITTILSTSTPLFHLTAAALAACVRELRICPAVDSNPQASDAEHVSGAENGAKRPENRVERSGAVSGRCRKTMERSGARSGGSRSGNEAGSGGYRIRLERGAAFSPAPLRSAHMLWSDDLRPSST